MANPKTEGKRKITQPPSARTPEKVRPILGAALEHAVAHSGDTQQRVAQWLNISTSSLRRWQRGAHRIDVEAVMCAPKLWRSFVLRLLWLERKAGWL